MKTLYLRRDESAECFYTTEIECWGYKQLDWRTNQVIYLVNMCEGFPVVVFTISESCAYVDSVMAYRITPLGSVPYILNWRKGDI